MKLRLSTLALASAFAVLTIHDVAFAQMFPEQQPDPPRGGATAAPGSKQDLVGLSLRQALLLAETGNRDVQLARAALDSATGTLTAAGKRPNPTLTLGAGPGLVGNYRPRDADILVNYSQLIERGRKRELRADAAGQAATAASFDLLEALRLLRVGVTRAYFALKLEQQRLEIALVNRDSYSASVRAAELKEKVGDIARVELVRLRVEAGRSENDVLQARADVDAAKFALGVVLGQERRSSALQATDPWPLVTELQETRMNELLDIRPDVRAAGARVRGAEAALELTHALRTRDVTVAMVAERNLPANGGTTLGVQVSAPLFINSNFEGEIVRANAELDAARITLEKVRASGRTDADRAEVLFQAARSQLLAFSGRILPDARMAVEAAEYAYGRGAMPLSDLLDARRQYYATQRQFIEAQATFAIANAVLESIVNPLPSAR